MTKAAGQPTRLVEEVRVASIWTVPFLDMLGKPPLGNPTAYQASFDAALSSAQAMTHPWPPDDEEVQHFWGYYLGGVPLEAVDAGTAWQALVPLRMTFAQRLVDAKGEFRLNAEALVYPFGASVIVTATSMASDTLDSVTDHVLALFRGPRIVRGQSKARPFGAIASELAAEVRASITAGGQASPTVDPFTVVTFTRTKGIDPAAAPDEATRKALFGLLSRVPEWRNADPMPPADTDVTLSRTRRPKAHVMVAAGRGRAVWFPQVSGRPTNTFSLGCYHRNLVFGSAHVDALGTLVRGIDARLSGGISRLSLAVDEREVTGRAGLRLAALWSGQSATYRSWSLRRQIGDEWKLNLSNILTAYDLPPLAP